MKKNHFPTQYSESVQKGSKEYNHKPSMTEPDNAMSIPEIIARFTRGQGIQVPVHPWQAGSASEDGRPVQDNELDTFMERVPANEPAPTQPAPTEPASEVSTQPSAGA